MHPEPSDALEDRKPKFLRSRRRVQRQASGPHLSEARAAEPWDAALLRAEPPAPHHHLQGVADISAWRFARSGRLEARRAVHRRPDQPEQLLVLGAVGAPDQELADPGARSSARRTRRRARA
jgi:hypothetical protein